MENPKKKVNDSKIRIELSNKQIEKLLLALECAKNVLIQELKSCKVASFREMIEADIKAIDELLNEIGGRLK